VLIQAYARKGYFKQAVRLSCNFDRAGLLPNVCCGPEFCLPAGCLPDESFCFGRHSYCNSYLPDGAYIWRISCKVQPPECPCPRAEPGVHVSWQAPEPLLQVAQEQDENGPGGLHVRRVAAPRHFGAWVPGRARHRGAVVQVRRQGPGQGFGGLGQHTVPQATVATVGQDQLRGSTSSPFFSSPVYPMEFFQYFPIARNSMAVACLGGAGCFSFLLSAVSEMRALAISDKRMHFQALRAVGAARDNDNAHVGQVCMSAQGSICYGPRAFAMLRGRI
jgi:hypothetical protein